jgi:hypothetical protein
MRTILLLLTLLSGMAWAAAPPAMPTPEQRKVLRERDAALARARTASKERKTGEVIAALEQALELNVRVNGPIYRYTEARHLDLSRWMECRQEWGPAIVHRQRVVVARERLDGEAHWRTIDARLALNDARRQSGRTAEQRARLAEAARPSHRAERPVRHG